jgi:hypothetical protein
MNPVTLQRLAVFLNTHALEITGALTVPITLALIVWRLALPA